MKKVFLMLCAATLLAGVETDEPKEVRAVVWSERATNVSVVTLPKVYYGCIVYHGDGVECPENVRIRSLPADQTETTSIYKVKLAKVEGVKVELSRELLSQSTRRLTFSFKTNYSEPKSGPLDWILRPGE